MDLILKINTEKILTLDEVRALEGAAKREGLSFVDYVAARLKELAKGGVK